MTPIGTDPLVWLGIALCLSQSAMFSGMNLAVFSLSRLRLEVEAASGSRSARDVLALRRDAHFLLTTVLWGNVGVNVLLTLLSDSQLAGIGAFLFSTVVITLLGEIAPQAYFSRNALRVALFCAPLLRAYQFLLFPIAKPCALLLDAWLGRESTGFFREQKLLQLIRLHIDAPEASDIDRIEGLGAMNFLSMDDLPVVAEGGPIDPRSVLSLPFADGVPVFPDFACAPDDPFLRAVDASGRSWVILTDAVGEPQLVLHADEFLRAALFRGSRPDPAEFCHRPVIVRSGTETLGEALSRLRFNAPHPAGIIENDVILLWADRKRVITGVDVFGRLMEGIAIPATTEQATT